ncbi:MAG: hypothetical protein AAGA88_02805 [Pseudomonadota bacterium]
MSNPAYSPDEADTLPVATAAGSEFKGAQKDKLILNLVRSAIKSVHDDCDLRPIARPSRGLKN